MENLSNICENSIENIWKDVKTEESSGASGGIVAGFRYFCKNAHVELGIEMVSRLTNL